MYISINAYTCLAGPAYGSTWFFLFSSSPTWRLNFHMTIPYHIITLVQIISCHFSHLNPTTWRNRKISIMPYRLLKGSQIKSNVKGHDVKRRRLNHKTKQGLQIMWPQGRAIGRWMPLGSLHTGQVFRARMDGRKIIVKILKKCIVINDYLIWWQLKIGKPF